jgi:hypothetical protein
MSLGRQFADIELRNARAMRDGQARWDNASPPEPSANDKLAAEAAEIIVQCEETIGRAQRALDAGNLAAARDLLIEAGRELAENAVAAWERAE